MYNRNTIFTIILLRPHLWLFVGVMTRSGVGIGMSSNRINMSTEKYEPTWEKCGRPESNK